MSAFEQFGRKAAKEILPTALVGAALVGLIALGSGVPWVVTVFEIVARTALAIGAVCAVVVILAMLWAGIAAVGRRLRPYLPVRVWQVEGPLGTGPWLNKPAEAAEFIKDERESNAYAGNSFLNKQERQAYRNAPDFTPAELKHLWWPGRMIERNGWSIQCRLIPGKELDREWDGW